MRTEIFPFGILRINQADLLLSAPCFNLFLTLDPRKCIAESLNVEQTIYVVLVCEARHKMVFVLIDTLLDVAREAHIKSAGFARHDVNIIRLHPAILMSLSLLRKDKDGRLS